MGQECTKCKEDLSQFMNFDYSTPRFIFCPNCDSKMEVFYEEVYDEETDEEHCYWHVEEYEED